MTNPLNDPWSTGYMGPPVSGTPSVFALRGKRVRLKSGMQGKIVAITSSMDRIEVSNELESDQYQYWVSVLDIVEVLPEKEERIMNLKTFEVYRAQSFPGKAVPHYALTKSFLMPAFLPNGSSKRLRYTSGKQSLCTKLFNRCPKGPSTNF